MTFDTLPKIVRRKLIDNKEGLLKNQVALLLMEKYFYTFKTIMDCILIGANKYKRKEIDINVIMRIINFLEINTPEVEQAMFPFIFGEEKC